MHKNKIIQPIWNNQMTLKEKINYLLSRGYTQQKIGDETGIEQSSVSRILNETQKSVSYQKGCALDAVVAKEKAVLEQRKDTNSKKNYVFQNDIHLGATRCGT